MINSNEYLKKCEELNQKGYRPAIEPGFRLARGFADLGFEEFYLLPNGQLVSVFTGTTSDWQPENAQYFFAVPTSDQLVAAILSTGKTIDKIEHQDQREFVVSLSDAEQVSFRSHSLEFALIDAAIWAHNQ